MKFIVTSPLAIIAVLMFAESSFAASATAPISCGQTYTVVSGDSLSLISKRAYGATSYDDLFAANSSVIGANPNMIFIGQQLTIPCLSGDVTIQISNVTNDGDDILVFTFNKTSAPEFVMNSGIIDPYLQEITEVTEGRVTFIDPPVMNRDGMVQLDLVTSGAVDGAYIFNGYLADSHPLLQLPMLPLMGGSAEQTAISLWRLHEKYLADTGYFDDAQLLGFVASPTAHIWRLNDAPVMVNENISDQNDYRVPYFEGLDTRGPAVVQEENKAMLAEFDEATNGSRTFFLAHGAARAAGLWDETRTVTEVNNGLYTPTFSVVLSNDAWARISDEDQAAILEVSGEAFAKRSASWDAFDNGHRQHMIDTGLNIVKADDALLAELEIEAATRAAPWIATATALGIPAADAIADYRADLDSLQHLLIYR